MSLVKCAECSNLLSNKTFSCLYCGYFPKGNCSNCKYFEREFYSDSLGKCIIANNEYIRKDKSLCPGAIKRFIY